MKQVKKHKAVVTGNNLSGVAVQFATQFGANATQYYVGVAVFRMENDILAHASMLNCYTIFLKQIICERTNVAYNVILVWSQANCV